MTVAPKKDVCIWESGKVGDQLYASYEITKGESKFVKVSIRNNNEEIVYSTRGKQHDDFSYSFDDENKITLCFSTDSKEPVDVSFRYQLGNELKPIKKNPREEFVTTNDVDNLADKLQSIASEIYALEDEQRYTREKQHNYKKELKKLGRKIIISCFFEMTIMLLCCMLQYFQYRSMIQ